MTNASGTAVAAIKFRIVIPPIGDTREALCSFRVGHDDGDSIIVPGGGGRGATAPAFGFEKRPAGAGPL